MKINRFVSGLAGIVLAACGQENNTGNNNNNNNNNNFYDGGYSDSGYVDGGDVKADGGQGNLPPVVIIEAKDDQGNVKTEFNVSETVHWNINNSYDPDCLAKNKCEGQGTYLPNCSRGIDYCRRQESAGGFGLFFPGVDLVVGYGSDYRNKIIRFTVKCFDLETKGIEESNKPFGESSYEININ